MTRAVCDYLLDESADGTRSVLTPDFDRPKTRGAIIDEAERAFRLWPDVVAVSVVGGTLDGWRIERPKQAVADE